MADSPFRFSKDTSGDGYWALDREHTFEMDIGNGQVLHYHEHLHISEDGELLTGSHSTFAVKGFDSKHIKY